MFREDRNRGGYHRLARAIRLFGKYQSTNLSAGMEYRAAFLTQVFAMILNNSAFIVLWIILFEQIGDINGYDFAAVMFLWSMCAVGYGMVAVFFGNSVYLSRIIYNGELDVYLLQPKPVLINLLMSRSDVSGWGDIMYGLILFVLTQPLTAGHIGLFLLFSVMFAALFVSIRVLYHSLTFFLGNAQELAQWGSDIMLTLCLYPGALFKGPALLALHSLVPAALAAWIPYELFSEFDMTKMLLLLASDAAIIVLSCFIFSWGLSFYESGNKIGARI